MSTQVKMVVGLPLQLYACLLVAQIGVYSAPLGAPNEENIDVLLAEGSETIYSVKSQGAASTIYNSKNLSKQYRSRTKNPAIANKNKFPTQKNTQNQENVPVIHLPVNGENDDSMSKTFLDLIPPTILNANKKIRPLKIHIIEHDDYIDYEVEFIELEENNAAEFPSDEDEYIDIIYDDVDELKDAVQNPTEKTLQSTVDDSNERFNYLLNKARRRHKFRKDITEENKTTQIQTNDEFINNNKVKEARRTNHSRKINTKSNIRKNGYRPIHRVKVDRQSTTKRLPPIVKPTPPTRFINKKISNRYRPGNRVIEKYITERPTTFGRFTETRKPTTATPFVNTNTPTFETNTQSSNYATKSTDISFFTPLSPYKTTEEDKKLTSTSIDKKVEEVTTGVRIDQTTFASFSDEDTNILPSLDISTIPTLLSTTHELNESVGTSSNKPLSSLSPFSEIKSELISIYNLTTHKIFTSETPTPYEATTTKYWIQNETDKSETEIVPNRDDDDITAKNTLHFSELFNSSKQHLFSEHSRESITDSDNTKVYSTHDFSQPLILTTETISIETDSPVKIDNTGLGSDIYTTIKSDEESIDLITTETETEITTIISEDNEDGLYREINPGQYHEVNPGQYHEVNPGQYHEINPGQYSEDPPENTEKDNNAKNIGVDKLTVDFNHGNEQDTKIYNVKANAGDFIIGEVGRIDVNSGQTLEGVRYTAVEGEVDIARISHILESFFGARTS